MPENKHLKFLLTVAYLALGGPPYGWRSISSFRGHSPSSSLCSSPPYWNAR